MWNGKRLLSLRNLKGLSRELLSDQVGIHARTLENYERDIKDAKRRVPDIDILEGIAMALDTTVAYLVGETDDPSRDALTKLPFTQEQMDSLGFRARRGSGELGDPKELEEQHHRLLWELYEITKKQLESERQELERERQKNPKSR